MKANSFTTVNGNDITFTTGTELKIGDTYRNGIVISINPGLLVATKDQSDSTSGLNFAETTEACANYIIRNEKELYNIRKYIEQNPLKWNLEKDKPQNIYNL